MMKNTPKKKRAAIAQEQLVRLSCCWLYDEGRKCSKAATTTKKVHADSEGIYRGQWFKIPVCDRHK